MWCTHKYIDITNRKDSVDSPGTCTFSLIEVTRGYIVLVLLELFHANLDNIWFVTTELNSLLKHEH